MSAPVRAERPAWVVGLQKRAGLTPRERRRLLRWMLDQTQQVATGCQILLGVSHPWAPRRVRFGGRWVAAREVVWRLKHGAPPTRTLAHTCGNAGCWSPDHIEATP